MKSFLAVVFSVAVVCNLCHADIITVGKGSYSNSTAKFDSEDHGPKFEVFATKDAPHPYPTSDWWTTVLTERFSKNLFAFPMAFRCTAQGLMVDRPKLLVAKEAVYSPFEPDFRIGIKGKQYEKADAAGWGDFTVDIQFVGSGSDWNATIGHGLPFVYATFTGGTPEIAFLSKAKVIKKTNDAFLVRVNEDVFYGFYFLGGEAKLNEADPNVTLHLPGCTYLAAAALPDEKSFESFRPAAFQRVVGSQVDYDYDMKAAKVTTTYRVETTPMKGKASPSYLALFPHHYKGQDLKFTDASYDSLRGKLRLTHADEFQTIVPFHGMLPFLPEPTSKSYDLTHLNQLLDKIASQKNFFSDSTDELIVELMDQSNEAFKHNDTYFGGKQIAHLARLIPIAEMAGNERAKTKFIDALRRELADWFTATPGEKDHYFYYDRKCGGLIGMNASFYAYDYTDHHFHYAHFVYSSAILSLYDRSFKDDYGQMVELLIHDFNSPDRKHEKFPHLRMMDAYEGHGWANGRGGWGEGKEDDGNDQESSSEAMHAWQAITMWGMVTGNDRLRDHGIWGYVTEASAINQYYFDVDDDIYPKTADTEFEHEFISMLQGGKASYAGYSDFSEYTFGIQYLPITPSSLYLGYDWRHVKRQYENFLNENGGVEDRWFDNIWMYQSLFDPDAVLEKYDESVTIDLDGNSFANVYRWIHFFAGVGQVDVSVTAPWPYVSAFRKGKQLTLVAYNPGTEPVEIPFANRTSGAEVAIVKVAPGKMATEVVVD